MGWPMELCEEGEIERRREKLDSWFYVFDKRWWEVVVGIRISCHTDHSLILLEPSMGGMCERSGKWGVLMQRSYRKPKTRPLTHLSSILLTRESLFLGVGWEMDIHNVNVVSYAIFIMH